MPTPTPDLIFSQTPATGLPAELVFGAADFVAPSVTVNAAFSLGGVALNAYVGLPVTVAGAFSVGTVALNAFVSRPTHVDAILTVGGVSLSAACVYDNRVTPWRDVRVLSPLGAGVYQTPAVHSQWSPSLPKREGRQQHWQRADSLRNEPRAGFAPSIPSRGAHRARWQPGKQAHTPKRASHQRAIFNQGARQDHYQAGGHRAVSSLWHLQTAIFHQNLHRPEWQTASAIVQNLLAINGASLVRAGRLGFSAPWQMAGCPLPGVHVIITPPVVPPTWWWDANLLFDFPAPATPYLLFGAQWVAPTTILYILPARFYMTAHTVYAQRLPDLADIPIFDASVAADAGSFCWTLQASGPASLFTLLAPTDGLPAQLRVWLDGIAFVFAVDALTRNTKFGQTGVTISGRSVTALIGAPWMRAGVFGNAGTDRNAQQLAQDALADTGIELDWGIGAGTDANAGLVDWLVSANAWSHQGTPLDAVQQIAQAAGGYLQSHRSAATLLTRHPYGMRAGDNPGAPWSWMTGAADVELAPDALITHATQRKDGPDINAVYVSGTTQGVLALVKRTGSAADKLQAMVSDALITHADAARQRGLAILGGAGPKYNVTLELPVLTGTGQPGVLDVGQLVQVNESTPWRGRVRAVSVAAKRPSLRQTVTLERHLETV